eukprot:9473491-Pyramimonas_sp.AAC.1
MDVEGGTVGTILRQGFLELFRGTELANEFNMFDFDRLRQGAYAATVPPPEYRGAPVPVVPEDDDAQPQIDEESKKWERGYRTEEGICDRRFGSFKAVNQHRMSARGVRDPWLQIVTTNVCPHCLAENADTSRAQRHVMDSLCRGGECATSSRYYGGRQHADRRA